MLAELRRRAAPFRNVLGFTFGHWRRHPLLLLWVCGGMLLSTLADVLMPIYAGKLIDAVAPVVENGSLLRQAALTEALWALGAMVGLGLLMVVMRHVAFIAIVCMVGLLISVAANRGITWSAIKERLPTFLDLGAFLLMVVLLIYAAIQSMEYYGA